MVRLTSPGDVAAAIPHLLGFVPDESLVVVALARPYGRVALTVRCDLADVGQPGFADGLRDILRRNDVTEVVLAVHTEVGVAPPWPDRKPFATEVADLTEALSCAGVARKDALLVRTGRWWSYACHNERCCPPEGTLVPEATAQLLREAGAWAGRRDVADSRGCLGARLEADRDAVAETAAALPRVDTLAGTAAVEHIEAAVSWYADGRSVLDPAGAAQALVALREIAVRDAAMQWTGEQCPGAVIWRDLLRRAPAGLVAPVATLVAVDAYRRGDGASCRIAVERALGDEPGYRLALLMGSVLDAGIPPRVLTDAVEASLLEGPLLEGRAS